MTSSQEYRNAYERFYNKVREYLWPYDVLEKLADVEVSIYTAFPNLDNLSTDLSKLGDLMKDARKEDEQLDEEFNSLLNLIDTSSDQYAMLRRVEEVNPDENKQIKPIKEEDQQ